MFEIQGTDSEKTEIAHLLESLQQTKTGQKIVTRVNHLLGENPFILKFNKSISSQGICTFKQIHLNPKKLSTPHDRIAVLGHELAHAMMWDTENAALQNASSLDEYALMRLLSETHAYILTDLILKELNPQQQPPIKKTNLPWWETIDLTTKPDRTLYLKKALTCRTGWSQSEVLRLNTRKQFPPPKNHDLFTTSCAKFLQEMDTDLTLDEVLQIKPYSSFRKEVSTFQFWKNLILGRIK